MVRRDIEKKETQENRALPDEILVAEFNYIAQTAFQANEDRARVSSFYVVTVGSLIVAILSTQFINVQVISVYLAFGYLFLFLALMGILTLLQLARLRRAWYESITAMNQIKDFYIQRNPGFDLEKAFAWRTATIPQKSKKNSISFLLSIEVCCIGAASLGTGLFFVLSAEGITAWFWAVLGGLVFFGFQLFITLRVLR